MIAESIGVAALALSGMTGSPENVASDKKDSFSSESQIVVSSKENTPTPMLRGWWDDTVHATATAALKAAGKMDPKTTFVLNALTGGLPDAAAGAVLNNANYQWNSILMPVFTDTRDESRDEFCITNQGDDSYSYWRFCLTNIKAVGCEVIAAYNLERKLGFNLSLAEVISAFETLGIQVGSKKIGGHFGSNPCQIWYFLDTLNVEYQKLENYSDFERLYNDDNEYHFILSSWNDWPWDSELHTFYEEKTFVSSTGEKRLKTYNKNYSRIAIDVDGIEHALSCPGFRNSQLYIYGYAIKK